MFCFLAMKRVLSIILERKDRKLYYISCNCTIEGDDEGDREMRVHCTNMKLLCCVVLSL